MEKIYRLILKNIVMIAVGVLTLSANSTSAWLAHQVDIPKDIKKFKK